ncbi:MAG TPA: 2-C-methyl-D-erythritol 4-phosphate cytidylyltransferase [Ignavibacteriaceae bacterium]|nr:2-C-methyl-D-erythritol 4-phosphate cytidylyltransferase [Ignavibacteriaceae bacterium]
MRTYAIIPAGGKGKRAGGKTPKQYLKLKGKEMIAHTLDIFQQSPFVDEIIVAVDHSYFDLLKKLKKKYGITKLTKIVCGGMERQDSVHNALKSINAEKDDLIIIHDAARPLLPMKILQDAIKTAIKRGNSLVCIKAKDTLLKGRELVQHYIDRTDVLYVQTPQIFKYADIMLAMKKAYEENLISTDESTLAFRVGIKINIVEGSVFNFKVTTKEDVDIIRKLIK